MVVEFRFIHAADLHLDSPFKGLNGLPDASRKQVQQSTFSALDALVQLAIDEQVDFVLIAGDVYDVKDRSLRAQLKFRKAAEQLTSEGIHLYVIHGNHDPLDGNRARLDWPNGVHFFRADQVQSFVAYNRASEAVATIEGISYRTAAVNESLVPLYSKKPVPGSESLYRIGMLHCNVDGNRNHDNYAPCTLNELIETGMDYWALGHIHTQQVLHREPWIVYSGCTQGRHMLETGEKGCFVVTVSGGQTDMRFHPLDQVRWEQAAIDIANLTTDQELVDAAIAAMEAVRGSHAGRNVMLRLVWTGRGPLHSRLQDSAFQDELIDELRAEGLAMADSAGHWVWLESCRVRTGVNVSLAALREEDHFLGDLLRYSERLFTDEEQLDAFVHETLEPLLTHRKMGKYVREALMEKRKELLTEAQEMALDLLLDEWSDRKDQSNAQ